MKKPWKLEYGHIYEGERVVCRKNFDVDDRDPQWLADAALILAAPALATKLAEATRLLRKRHDVLSGEWEHDVNAFLASQEVPDGR